MFRCAQHDSTARRSLASGRITAKPKVIERQPRILPLRVRMTGLFVSARRMTANREIALKRPYRLIFGRLNR
jgi:hypothetical protein